MEAIEKYYKPITDFLSNDIAQGFFCGILGLLLLVLIVAVRSNVRDGKKKKFCKEMKAFEQKDIQVP